MPYSFYKAKGLYYKIIKYFFFILSILNKVNFIILFNIIITYYILFSLLLFPFINYFLILYLNYKSNYLK
jgi:hypothetical protein